jgi:hypothetical protein
MALWMSVNGYWCISFWFSGKRTRHRVHRLVAAAFVDNPGDKPEVDHLDGDCLNNHASNLAWADRTEQMTHVYHRQRSSPLRKHNGHADECPF